MSGPLRVHLATDGSLPLVLDSPHSGTVYPDDFDHAPPRSTVRQAEDTFVAELYAAAPRFGATLIEALFPRAYIDPNRHVADIDTMLLEDRWTGPVAPSRKTERGMGLVWRIAPGGAPMYSRRLKAAELARRIGEYYAPYHAAVTDAVSDSRRRFGSVWHINCHSMASVGDATADDPGRARADFVLGDRDGSTCAPEFTRLVANALSGLGYSVAINDPYKGVELVRMHGRPQEGQHSLQLEINRRLYMDEATLQKHGGFDVLHLNLGRMLEAVRGFILERLRR